MAKRTTDLTAIETRLHEAFWTLRSLPPPHPQLRHRTRAGDVPQPKPDWDYSTYEKFTDGVELMRLLLRQAKFTPTAKQIDDLLPAMALLNGFEPWERRLIELRSLQVFSGKGSFGWIADQMRARYRKKYSDEWWRQTYYRKLSDALLASRGGEVRRAA